MSATVVDVLRRHLHERPGAVAVVDGGRRVTFAELDAASDACADALRRLGVRPGDRVALLDWNSAEFVEIFFACAKAGAVLVPLNARLTASDLGRVLASSDPAVVIGRDALVTLAADAVEAAGVEPAVVAIGMTNGAGGYRDWAAPPARRERESGQTPSGLVYLAYTSGTTGGPKGVMIGHRAWLTFLPAAAESWDLGPGSTNLVPLPLFHIGGISWFLAGFLVGATSVVLSRPDPDEIMTAIEAHGITHVNVVPPLLRAMINVQTARPRTVTSLVTMTCGGAPIPPVVLQDTLRLLGCRVVCFYGLTEAGGGVAHHSLDEQDLVPERADRLLCAGRPIDSVSVDIRDPVDGARLPVGGTGEIVVHSPGVMFGYWAQPELSRAAFTTDGWLRTGDVGHLSGDGELFIQGRTKDVIISGGENIYAAEVENALVEHPGVLEACVVGVPDERWGETPVAVVVGDGRAEIDAGSLATWCRRRLARYKCPSSITIVPALPRTPTGKIAKNAVRESVLPTRPA